MPGYDAEPRKISIDWHLADRRPGMAMTDPLPATTASSDADLIDAVRSGHPDAYGILYQRHAGAARRLASQISRRPADIDDIVAETFARVLAAIRRGAGPSAAFRPYLLTAARRVAIEHVQGQRGQVPTGDAELPDPGEPFADPVEAGLERSLVARAFASLPERWSAVLWHTEIEQARPAEVALLLGISPNGVAALRYRAREGLRQAYLQMHLSHARAECRPFAGKLGGYVRHGLSRRDARQVAAHLSECADCRQACAELTSVNDTMRRVLAPLILGGQAAAYLGHGRFAATIAAGLRTGLRWLRMLVVHRPLLPVAAGVVAAAVAVPTVVLVQRPAPGTPGPSRPAAAGPGGPVARPGRHSAATPQPPGGSGLTVPPGGSPTRSPTMPARPSPTGTATPTPSAPRTVGVKASAKLALNVTVNGLLNLGVVDTVSMQVSDPGTAATGGISARIALPAGITLLGLGSSSSGWSCSGSSCAHGSLAAGAAATVSFRILVASLASCGDPLGATAVSGALSAAAQSAATIACAPG